MEEYTEQSRNVWRKEGETKEISELFIPSSDQWLNNAQSPKERLISPI
jgi:hypothetical protein